MDTELFIVDDNPDLHFLIYNIFKQFDKSYRVKFFEDGRSLYRHLDALSQRLDNHLFPGLIILDLNMPGMSGMQLLTLLKQPTKPEHVHLKDIPVVVMSSDDAEEKIIQCYKRGADAYVIKPVEHELMKSTLQAVCKFFLRTGERNSPLSIAHSEAASRN
ncbi:response regulator [Dyadobacter sp. CY347]|uniref:response regulator n=1 Tax=Dyadobacter sp. CY347 TaxID=2909336 RepID=UPI001F1B520A|nr:response regulator [Dyadobacter sp. CY347]MCF2488135.1 response regulator [Dyadobacter sp. CY347]